MFQTAHTPTTANPQPPDASTPPDLQEAADRRALRRLQAQAADPQVAAPESDKAHDDDNPVT